MAHFPIRQAHPLTECSVTRRHIQPHQASCPHVSSGNPGPAPAPHLLGPLGEAASLHVLQRVVAARVPLSLVIRRHPQALGCKAGALGRCAARQPQQQLRVSWYQLVRRRVPCADTLLSCKSMPAFRGAKDLDSGGGSTVGKLSFQFPSWSNQFCKCNLAVCKQSAIPANKIAAGSSRAL